MADQRDNSGTLRKNDKKTEPNHADYKGSAKIGGVDFWLDGWVKNGQYGTFLSLAIKPKQPAQQPAQQPQANRPASQRTADHLPF